MRKAWLIVLLSITVLGYAAIALIGVDAAMHEYESRQIRGTVAEVHADYVMLKTNTEYVKVSRRNLVPEIRKGDTVIIETRRIDGNEE